MTAPGFEERSLSGPRGRVAYRLWPGPGPGLLLLAGVGSTSRIWGELPRLLARRFTVIAADNRGVGGSRGGSPFSLEGAAEDAALVIADAGLDGCAVLGASLGGAIAVHLGARHPALVGRLVLVSCPLSATASHCRVMRFFEIALTRLQPSDAAELFTTFAFGSRFTDAYPGFLRQAAEAWQPAPDDVTGTLEQIRGVASRFDLRPIAARVCCPTLVVTGDRDPIVSPDASRALAALIPGARLLVVPDAAHSPLAEGGPELLNDLVGFLRTGA